MDTDLNPGTGLTVPDIGGRRDPHCRVRLSDAIDKASTAASEER